MGNVKKILTIVLATGVLAVGNAQAGFTQVGPNSLDPAGNSLSERLQGIFGVLSAGGINSDSMVLGGTTFYRLDDDNNSLTDLSSTPDTTVAGRSGNKFWSDGTAKYMMELKLAANQNEFGIDQAGLNPLVNSMGVNSTSFTVTGPFQLYLENMTLGQVFRSGDAGASSGTSGTAPKDNMIAWYVDNGGSPDWVVAWEDRPSGSFGSPTFDDRDYQDLVATISLNMVPLPAPAAIGGSAFVFLGLAYWARNRRRTTA